MGREFLSIWMSGCQSTPTDVCNGTDPGLLIDLYDFSKPYTISLVSVKQNKYQTIFIQQNVPLVITL
jgi:hypothetical protein